MTVAYAHDVATAGGGFGNFGKLLFRWTGSIYKLVLPELCIYIILYYLIQLPYRFLLKHRKDTDISKIYFHDFVRYTREASTLIPWQFILGFYVSEVFTRWWNVFMTIPWPDTLAVTVACTVRGRDERSRLMRRTILRYVNTTLIMVFCMLSPHLKSRFPTLDDMVDGGLFVPHEKSIIEELNKASPGPKYFVPAVWAGAVASKARKEGRIREDIGLYTILKEICVFRKMAQDLLSYDWVTIPLVYTQVTTLCTYAYFLSCLMGKQLIKDEVDISVPIFSFLEFLFVLGWLKVTATMIDPFGMDDDDFEVNWLTDRNLTLSYLIVDEMNNEFPDLIKDAFWDGIIPEELLYTPDSLKYKTDGMGDGSAAINDQKNEALQEELVQPRRSFFQNPVQNQLTDEEAVTEGRRMSANEEFIHQLLENRSVPDYKDSEEDIRLSQDPKPEESHEAKKPFTFTFELFRYE